MRRRVWFVSRALFAVAWASATRIDARCLIHEVKQRGCYETKSFDLHRDFNSRAHRKRADVLQAEKGPSEAHDAFCKPGHERCPTDAIATHLFKRAFSTVVGFERAATRVDVWNGADANAHEHFVEQSTHNDKHCGAEAGAWSFHQ